MAVEVLKARGVPEDHILFLNLIASPEGISKFAVKFPRLKVVTAFVDEVCKLFQVKRIRCPTCSLTRCLWLPGLGREEVP
jgi:hypothetical protein